jgi:flavin reductase (DIM6/NTAB) family NADH-FMN oxidoreductase RutF
VQVDLRVPDPTTMYKLLIGCVVPRPIAWVSSVDAAGVRNLAPFSYFMAITHDPPTVAFSSSPRGAELAGARGKKDTLRNVEVTREFVVNVVDDALAEQMNLTSGDYPAEVDEFTQAGLAAAPSVKVKARLAGHQYTHVHDIFEMKRPAVDYKG